MKVHTVYCFPKFRNILTIHLLSALSYDPNPKYITSETKQRFIPSPGVCIVYTPHRSFSEYLEYPGRISVIGEIAEEIEYLIPEHFHLLLSMDKDSSIHIYSFNMVAKNLRTPTDHLPAFLQCVRHTKFGTIFGLSLPDLSVNYFDSCNRVLHFLYDKLT